MKVFWSSLTGRESRSERRASVVRALSTAVWQARMEETSLENSPKYSSAGMAASEAMNRMDDERLVVERPIWVWSI